MAHQSPTGATSLQPPQVGESKQQKPSGVTKPVGEAVGVAVKGVVVGVVVGVDVGVDVGVAVGVAVGVRDVGVDVGVYVGVVVGLPVGFFGSPDDDDEPDDAVDASVGAEDGGPSSIADGAHVGASVPGASVVWLVTGFLSPSFEEVSTLGNSSIMMQSAKATRTHLKKINAQNFLLLDGG
jgi:hypothetical protein